MATNRTLRRVNAGGEPVDLHPATIVANVYQDTDENARSTFSQNLWDSTYRDLPTVEPSFIKVGTAGGFTWATVAGDVGASATGHGHAISDVTIPDSAAILGSLVMNDSQANFDANPPEYRRIIGESNRDFGGVLPAGRVLAAYIQKYIPDIVEFTGNATYKGRIRIDYYVNDVLTFAYGEFMDPVTTVTGSLLSEHLTDNVNGKVPLGVGGFVDESYLPTYSYGRMIFRGTVSLAAGNTTANAINVSSFFTDYNVDPDKKLGSFYIVSAAGYIKADGVTNSGTEFLHTDAEGPIWLTVGDRVVFVQFIDGSPARYQFAFLHHDFRLASTTVSGIMSFSEIAGITNRGSLQGTTGGLTVVTEAQVRNAMRDIVYVDNVPEVAITAAAATVGHAYVATAVITGEPTHTSGTVSGAYILGLDEGVDAGVYVVFSTGKCYRAVTIAIGVAINWEYVSTITVPSVPAGSLARCAGTEIYMLVTLASPNVFVYTITNFLEGDIVIGA